MPTNELPSLLLLAAPDGATRLAALRSAAPLMAHQPADEHAVWRDRAAMLVRDDPAPLVRRAALALLGSLRDPPLDALLDALSDPVWRVRMVAVRLLARLGQDSPAWQDEALRAAGLRVARADLPATARGRVAGAVALVADAWRRPAQGDREPWPRWGDDARQLPVWDEDPAVRLLNLNRVDLRPHLALLPQLLLLDDGVQMHDILQGTRSAVVEALLAHGATDDDARMLALLDEPRFPYVLDWVTLFLDRLPGDRREALRQRVRDDERATPAASRWARGERVPERGSSYFVPFTPTVAPWATAPLVNPAADVPRRRLGAHGPMVAGLGLSGRYALPSRAYAAAVEAGVDLLFWEFPYEAIGTFIATLPSSRRAPLTIMSGSFEASPRAVRRDLELALRLLKIDRLDVFVLFWARSSGRLSDDVLDEMERLRDAGKLGVWGLSTHDRALGEEALANGAEVVMLRYSAAHRGAEARLLPAIQQHDAGAVAFSCMCHGKLLDGTSALHHPEAPDMYRLALAHPAITTCLTAPRDEAELRANLSVLNASPLSPDRLDELRRHGDEVYRGNRRFFEQVRSR